MSYVDKSKLKGILDQTLSFFNTTLTFTTATLTIDSLTQFGAYIRSFRIVNNDAANNCQYRTVSTTDPLKNVPPSSDLIEEGWESFIQIVPDAVAGTGFIELELIEKKVAERNPEPQATPEQTPEDLMI